jgi:hypothetical protein
MRSKFRYTSAQTMCHIASDHANFSNAHAFSRINRTATGSNGIPYWIWKDYAETCLLQISIGQPVGKLLIL